LFLNMIEASVKFVSCEPLLSEINFEQSLGESLKWHAGGLKNCISWVIVGGETGNKARPVHPDWVSSIRDQCEADGVPFFFKGWGQYKNGSDYVYYKTKNHIVLSNGEFSRWDNDDWKSISRKYNSEEFNKLKPFVVCKVGKKESGDLLDGKQYHEFPKI
jgi:hypothetical protein